MRVLMWRLRASGFRVGGGILTGLRRGAKHGELRLEGTPVSGLANLRRLP